MTTITRNNKKIAAGIAAAAAAVLAIGAGTFAFFSDTEAGPNASATAGTLDLVPGAGNTSPLLTEAGIAPGYDSGPKTLSYQNAGSIDGKLSLDFVVTGTENGCNEPEDEAETGTGCTPASELLDQLLVSVDGAAAIPVNTLADILSVNVGAGLTKTYEFVFSLPNTAVNDVQSDTISVVTTATLDQDPADTGV